MKSFMCKVKVTLEEAMKAQVRSEGIAVLLSLTSVLEGVGGSAPCSGLFTPRE